MEKAENTRSQGSTKGQHTTLRDQDGGSLNSVWSRLSPQNFWYKFFPDSAENSFPSAWDLRLPSKMCLCTHMQELLLGANWKHLLPWCCPGGCVDVEVCYKMVLFSVSGKRCSKFKSPLCVEDSGTSPYFSHATLPSFRVPLSLFHVWVSDVKVSVH